ncbi:MAG: beta-phosphoglucomutase family hydrolase [Thermoanaerobaculia bacterium]
MSNTPYKAAILDLDGVLTDTASLHARAWKEMFDDFLERRPEREKENHSPFEMKQDYLRYVDGKPRFDGVRSFLESRRIDLPEGSAEDSAEEVTVRGLGMRKDQLFRELLGKEPVQVFDDAVEQVRRWKDQGLRIGLITSSRNGRRVLQAVNLGDLFDVIVDGNDAAELDIRGKPAPDVFLHAAQELGVEPHEAFIVEDAISGVEAGRAGGFALVVGVARHGGEELADAGADLVVKDLREVDDQVLADGGPGRDASSRDQAAASRRRELAGREMRHWELIYRSWDPERQPLREVLCAVGNGLLVTRGAFEEVRAGGPHYPGTYMAGGYNRLETEIAGRVVENEDLVNWPNWLPLTFRHKGGHWFSLDEVDVLDFTQRLDVYRGVLEREVRFRDTRGRESSLVSRRIVHIADPHLAAIEWTLKALNWSGEIEIRSELDGTVLNGNVERYQDLSKQHLDILATGYADEDTAFLTVATSQSRIRMTQAARTRVFSEDGAVKVQRTNQEDDGRVGQVLLAAVERQKSLRVEKIVAIRTSRDHGISEPEINAIKDVRRAGTFAEMLDSHECKWRQLWSISDIVLSDGDDETQLILRLHIFHLLQSASTNTIDRDVGVPARGWHGEAYRGHIFWDELFIFPFLTLRIPELARSLLMYRYRRLNEARHLAREAGYEGAMFPWQSGSDGREESQTVHLNPKSGRWLPDVSNLQRHVNAAVAYNVWRYYQASGDMEFLSSYGAEMLVENARFWASISSYDLNRERYEIRGVMGPDEFHTAYPDVEEPGLNNNAYTNVMAAWVLRCAGHSLDLLDEEQRNALEEKLNIGDEELVRWQEISRNLFVPFHGDGIISQFERYEELEEFDWQGYRESYGDIQRLDRILEAEGDDVNRYQASKQADVLMLFYLFSAEELRELFEYMGLPYDPELIPRNIDYYTGRTSHGSTLSRIVHYWVMGRADREHDWMLFQTALRSDIDDIQGGTTHEGIHLGAMAGTVDLIQRSHTGIEIREGVLWFNPKLPRELTEVRMRLHYHQHWMSVLLTDDTLTVSFDRGWSPSARIGYRGEVHEMEQGETREFRIEKAETRKDDS